MPDGSWGGPVEPNPREAALDVLLQAAAEQADVAAIITEEGILLQALFPWARVLDARSNVPQDVAPLPEPDEHPRVARAEDLDGD